MSCCVQILQFTQMSGADSSLSFRLKENEGEWDPILFLLIASAAKFA